MLGGAWILIAEGDPQIAELLARSVEAHDGRVVGPFVGCRQTEEFIETEDLPAGAILDFRLADGEVMPIASYLVRRGVPVVICAGAHPPNRPRTIAPHLAYLPNPASTEEVVDRLEALLDVVRGRTQPS